MYSVSILSRYGPQWEKTCLRSFANNKGADQPAHPRSLISAFVIHYLENTVVKLAPCKIPFLWLVSVAEETVLIRLCWKPQDRFSPIEAHIVHLYCLEARGATIYRYTGKPRFTLNKYRIAIHFWPYRYRSLPYVSSSQFSSKICKKISIIGFEIAQKSGRFQNR